MAGIALRLSDVRRSRRGRAICANHLAVPEALANAAVLTELKASLLNPAVLEAAVARAVDRLCAPDDDGRALKVELARVERELQHYARAVASGGDVPALVAAMRTAEERRLELSARLRAVETTGAALNPASVRAELEARLALWRSLLTDNATQARGVLRQLIVGRLALYADADGRGYRFTGTGTLAPLLESIIPTSLSVSRKLASPAGFEPAFWP